MDADNPPPKPQLLFLLILLKTTFTSSFTPVTAHL
jgi:hypothetical protein